MRVPLDKAHASAFAPFAATKELYGQPIKTQKQQPQRQKGDEGWKDRLNRRKEAVAAGGAAAAARNGIWQKDEAAVAAANEQLQRLNDNKAEASATQPPQVKTPSGEAMKRLNMWNAKTGSSEAVDLADEAAVADLLASSGGVGDTEVDLIVQAMEDPIQKEAASQLAKGAERALREPDAHTNSNSNWIGRLHARLASMLGDSTAAAPEAPKATSEAAAADDDDTAPPLVYGELEEDEELEDYQWDEYEVRGAAASVGGGDWDDAGRHGGAVPLGGAISMGGGVAPPVETDDDGPPPTPPPMALAYAPLCAASCRSMAARRAVGTCRAGTLRTPRLQRRSARPRTRGMRFRRPPPRALARTARSSIRALANRLCTLSQRMSPRARAAVTRSSSPQAPRAASRPQGRSRAQVRCSKG